MKHIILILLYLYCFVCNAQVQLAFSINKDSLDITDIAYRKNLAIISDAIIKIKGPDWFKENIINNCYGERHERANIICTMSIDYFGNIEFIFPQITKNDSIQATMKKVAELLENEHVIFYEYNGYFSSHFKRLKSKSKNNIKNLIIEYIKKTTPTSFLSFYNPWICSFPPYFPNVSYESYVKEIENKGLKALDYPDWLIEKIQTDMRIPIQSTIDYGIKNDDFIIID